MSTSINVIFTDHARERAMEHNVDLGIIEAIVHRANPFAPRWPEAAAALESETLPVDPLVKFFSQEAVILTFLPHGVPLQANTEVVYV